VLNARGPHGRDHLGHSARPAHRRRVLNARGRHGRDHATRSTTCSPAGGAQRPRASWSGSPYQSPRIHHFTRCSTPEGVMVEITSLGDRGRDGADVVLNARRRHGRDHSSRDSDSLASAIVLNARRRHGRDHLAVVGHRTLRGHVLNARRRHGRDHASSDRRRVPPRRCAQRPKASWSRSRSVPGGTNATSKRAQRPKASWSRSHRHGTRGQQPVQVLNARRRHGRDHPLTRDKRKPVVTCSTPEGVMVEITPGGPGPVHSLVVLNARRRHGRDHRLSTSSHRSLPMCSTPEGVMVEITYRLWRTARLPWSVLNARRRHGRDHVE